MRTIKLTAEVLTDDELEHAWYVETVIDEELERSLAEDVEDRNVKVMAIPLMEKVREHLGIEDPGTAKFRRDMEEIQSAGK